MMGMEKNQSPEYIEAVHHVLGHHGHPAGYRPGSFTTGLLDLWGKADFTNQARLASAFPELGQVIAVLQRSGLSAVAALVSDPEGDARFLAATVEAARQVLGYFSVPGYTVPPKNISEVIKRWQYASSFGQMNLSEGYPALGHVLSIKSGAHPDQGFGLPALQKYIETNAI